jgi:hypothetical protein
MIMMEGVPTPCSEVIPGCSECYRYGRIAQLLMCTVCQDPAHVFETSIGLCLEPGVTCTSTPQLYERPNGRCEFCK